MKMFLQLNRDEIEYTIPYALICETMGGSIWGTGKQKREFAKAFTEAERRKCTQLYKLARNWYLVKGVPDKLQLTPDTLKLWVRLGDFCAML